MSSYITRQIGNKEPLLFLLKLSDHLEDTPASRISLYSSNHGDNKNLTRRPHLAIEWESGDEIQKLEKKITLEHGRTYYLPRIDNKEGRKFFISFDSSPEYEPPTIEVRGGDDETISDWRQVVSPFKTEWSWLEFKISAVRSPIVLGNKFKAKSRDTWIESGPPEEQKVPWHFLSPTGISHKIFAKYIGEYEWEVDFQPDELGRWRYYWTHRFTSIPYKSPLGAFDVIIRDPKDVKKQLQRLAEKIESADLKTHYERMKVFEAPFSRLERAALRFETPESFHSKSGDDLRNRLDEVRTLIWKKPIPKFIPPKPFPRDW
ncbi:MAG: hypothetical protein ACE5GN_01715 [Waddliaceae bacterium]